MLFSFQFYLYFDDNKNYTIIKYRKYVLFIFETAKNITTSPLSVSCYIFPRRKQKQKQTQVMFQIAQV